MMHCSHCGALSAHEVRGPVGQWMEWVENRCERGHKFFTLHVHPRMLGEPKRLHSATRALRRRAELWARDTEIANDDRPATEVAKQHKITSTRVRQIRASMRPATLSREEGKSSLTTQKG